MVGGKLPLDELRRAGNGKALYLQCELQVRQAGDVDIQFDASGPITFWVDEDPYENQTKATVSLTPGRHRITARVMPGGNGQTLRLDVRKAANSKASFEIE